MTSKVKNDFELKKKTWFLRFVISKFDLLALMISFSIAIFFDKKMIAVFSNMNSNYEIVCSNWLFVDVEIEQVNETN